LKRHQPARHKEEFCIESKSIHQETCDSVRHKNLSIKNLLVSALRWKGQHFVDHSERWQRCCSDALTHALKDLVWEMKLNMRKLREFRR